MLEMFNALFTGLLQVFNWSTFSLMMIGIADRLRRRHFARPRRTDGHGPDVAFHFQDVRCGGLRVSARHDCGHSNNGRHHFRSCLECQESRPRHRLLSMATRWREMARRGEHLGAVLMSSLVGAIFAGVALAVAIPVVRPIVLSFGSPEFFMLSLLGITFVAP